MTDNRLGIEQIDYRVKPQSLSPDDVKSWGKQFIGQPRAIAALVMGTSIRSKGYNILVSGMSGTGRRTAVMDVVSRYRESDLEVMDILYVSNFHNLNSPRPLIVPSGEGIRLKKDLHDTVENIKKIVKLQGESKDYKKQSEAIMSSWEREENKRLAEFEAKLKTNGFQVIQQQGDDGVTTTDIVPVVDGKAVDFDELAESISDEGKEIYKSLKENYYAYMDEMRQLFVSLKRGRTKVDNDLRKLKSKILRPFIEHEVTVLRDKYDYEQLRDWFSDLIFDMLDNLHAFEQIKNNDNRKGRSLCRYGVNILNSHPKDGKIPIVYETNPTLANLFGSIEPVVDNGGIKGREYSFLRPGSIIKANGGFLIIQLEDILQEEDLWMSLKRVLRTGNLEILSNQNNIMQQTTIKPEPVEVDFKLILIGGESSYDMLYQADPEFKKLFKIHSEFDSSVQINDDILKDYVSFTQKIIQEEELRDVEVDGIAEILNYGIRLSENQKRISTQFSSVADLLRESDYHAAKEGHKTISKISVARALQTRKWLSSLPEEKLTEMIVAGEILLNVSGYSIGRVNGLAVHDRGYFSFGLPAVISAQVSPGENGVINIEGESGLSGEIYDKAVLIVEGFIRSKYARDFPLNITASICFEQSYTAIEGDSASSTAVYALLSAISQLPLRQDIAVTGSMNQMGQIQPVGGVTEKVEGFYSICKKAGFTGTQGVIIPRQNIVNLVLNDDVLDAVKNGLFSLYSVSTIDEGMAILTGKPEYFISDSDADHRFNSLVKDRLREMVVTVKKYNR